MPQFFGPYEVGARIGAGGMGEVFRAIDTRLGRAVALKVLPSDRVADPEARARFEREARSIAALHHPNICAIFDVGLGDPTQPPYLVMELLEGETLQDRLIKGPLDLEHVVEYGVALADALDTAHARGLIHRDLKPANVFLTSRGVPKILDFGLAKPLVDTDSDVTRRSADLTELGTTVGTIAYMSPEQLRAEPLDVRSDLFSLGLVLYEMATGQRAFAGATSPVVSAAILGQEPVRPRSVRSDLPEGLEATILKTLEKDRNLRTQSAAELRADLQRLKRQSGSQWSRTEVAAAAPMPAPPPAPQPAPASRTTLWIGLAVAAALIVGGAYALGVFGSSDPGTTTPLSGTAVTGTPVATATPVAQATSVATPPPTATPVTSPTPAATATPVASPSPSPDAARDGRGRGPVAGRRGAPPAMAALVSILKELPPIKFDLAYAQGDARARESALQLRTALTAAGWSAESTAELANPPAGLAILVPQPNASVSALVNWARRNGFNPDVRPTPRSPRVRIVIGRQ